ncbi:hypothetical protein FACS189496_4220 [Bacilli bacterium]|nr:hypothetical protein FACS189496_4220 [Bacilli bacterium]
MFLIVPISCLIIGGVTVGKEISNNITGEKSVKVINGVATFTLKNNVDNYESYKFKVINNGVESDNKITANFDDAYKIIDIEQDGLQFKTTSQLTITLNKTYNFEKSDVEITNTGTNDDAGINILDIEHNKGTNIFVLSIGGVTVGKEITIKINGVFNK